MSLMNYVFRDQSMMTNKRILKALPNIRGARLIGTTGVFSHSFWIEGFSVIKQVQSAQKERINILKEYELLLEYVYVCTSTLCILNNLNILSIYIYIDYILKIWSWLPGVHFPGYNHHGEAVYLEGYPDKEISLMFLLT